jgi:hypothetical protein
MARVAPGEHVGELREVVAIVRGLDPRGEEGDATENHIGTKLLARKTAPRQVA